METFTSQCLKHVMRPSYPLNIMPLSLTTGCTGILKPGAVAVRSRVCQEGWGLIRAAQR